MGSRYFHSRVSSWSILSLGKVHLNHIIRKITPNGLSEEPEERRDEIHHLVESVPAVNMKRHPAAKKYGGGNGGDDEHVNVFGKEEEGEFDPGIFCMEPAVSSDSASARSKGPLFVSAVLATMIDHEGDQGRDMSLEDEPSPSLGFNISESCMVPARTTMVISDSPTESS